MGTVGPLRGAKRGRGVTLTTHPHLMPRSRMSRSYISSPPSAFMACSGTALAFLYFNFIQLILILMEKKEIKSYSHLPIQEKNEKYYKII
jgi:hypothetical protein